MISSITMLRAMLASLLFGLAATTSSAQTTGVAGFNDFTIGGSTSGASSCTLLNFPGGPTTFNVNTAPGAPVVLLINFSCPCSPCFFSFGSTTSACPIPNSTCGGTTNQSLDLDPTFVFCTFIAVAMPAADAAGNSTLVVPLPPPAPAYRFSVQALAFHPCNTTGIFPPVFTQAYNVGVP